MTRSKVLPLTGALAALVAVSGWARAQDNTAAQPPAAAAPEPALPPSGPEAQPVPAPAIPPQEVQATPPSDEAMAPAPARGGKKQFGEEITVTGSRIRRKDLTTPAPVTVISRDQVLASGKVSLGDFLQSLPEQGNAINTSVNNGGDGSTHINLRGLGDQRTLVLVNGRRFVGNAFSSMVQDPSVDLNAIPTSVIERIEILKDGASAVYGSDAIAGVVNVITRRRFEGAEATAMAGISTHGDGNIYDVSATAGSSNDNGSVMFSAGYYNQSSVFANARDWSKNPQGFDFDTGKPFTYGSSIIPNGRFFLPSGGPSQTFDPTLNGGAGGYRNFKGGLPPEGDAYNFQPYNYLLTPQQRITLFSAGDHNLGGVARAYYEASFVNRQSSIYQAPEPFILSNEAITISGANAYNPFGTLDPANSDVFRRMVEGGPRRSNTNVDTFRVVLGVDGTMPGAFGPLAGWFWDVALNYGRSNLSEDIIGNYNRNRLQKALGPTTTDPNTGALACADPATGAPLPGCVPLDLFHGAGSITPEMIDYVRTHLANNSFNEQTQLLANTSGELFPLLADRPVGLALGYELRRVRGQYTPDALVAMGEVTGNKGEGTGGAYTANEGYAELSIPIVNHLPFVEDLEASAAARVFNYSNFGTDWTYKLGARWSIVPDVTIRGTYSTAYRAPSIIDLYSGLGDTFLYLTDPCSGLAVTDPSRPKSCGTASYTQDPNTQVRASIGGNAKLQPETAKIYTAGLVVQPRWIRNLTVTADYYNINVDTQIGTYGSQYILDQCFNGNGNFCGLITRNPNGSVNDIVDINQNVGSQKTDGLDLSIRYALPTEVGRFGFIFDGTWLHKFDIYQPDGTIIHAKGTFDGALSGGTGGVYPAIKFNAGLTYNLANFGSGVSMRYIGGYDECDPSGGLQGGGSYCYVSEQYKRQVSQYATFDLFLSYMIQSEFGRTSISGGVQNIFNADPAAVYSGFTAASDPTAYDFMGRYFYLRLAQSI